MVGFYDTIKKIYQNIKNKDDELCKLCIDLIVL